MLKIAKRKDKAQVSLEFTVMFLIIVGALMTVSNYFKRSVQGRWKITVDGLGTQYDPRMAEADVKHAIYSVQNTELLIKKDPSEDFFYTSRTDHSRSQETKQGVDQVETY